MARRLTVVIGAVLLVVGAAVPGHAQPVDGPDGINVDVRISPLDGQTPTPTPTDPEPTEPEPTEPEPTDPEPTGPEPTAPTEPATPHPTDPGAVPPELPATGVDLSLLPYLAGAALLLGAALLASRRRT